MNKEVKHSILGFHLKKSLHVRLLFHTERFLGGFCRFRVRNPSHLLEKGWSGGDFKEGQMMN